jgi:hypothetical protein
VCRRGFGPAPGAIKPPVNGIKPAEIPVRFHPTLVNTAQMLAIFDQSGKLLKRNL